jgi:hypothetical protein
MSFISDYLLFTSNTESPIDYHKWSCMSTLSVLAGRRFWFRLGPITYYPNLYVVLVGNPGVKKSSALDRAKDIVRSVGCCPIAAAQATKEFIAKAMSNEKFKGKRFFKNGETLEEYNQYAIFATELTQFIAVNPMGMLDFLTTVYTEKVYDCDTKGQGSDLVVGPYITLLACLTPEMLKGFVKLNILTGGFARRTIFVYGTAGAPVPWPGFTNEQVLAQERCVQHGKEMQSYSGEFLMDDSAKKWYEDWYIDLRERITEIAKPSTEGYYRTKQEVLFKTSMLCSLSEDPSNATLTAKHLEFVENMFLLPYEKNLERVFEGAGINPNAEAAVRICRMLEAADVPMPRKRLEGIFYSEVTSYRELTDLLAHLISVGRIVERRITNNGTDYGSAVGSPSAMARATPDDLLRILMPPRSGPSTPPPSGEGHS